jgi:hypothetical protein
VSDEGDLLLLLVSSFHVEQISTAKESFFIPPVRVHSIDSGCLLFSINDHTFVNSFLVSSEPFVHKSRFGFVTLDNFNSIVIDHLGSDNCSLSIIKVVREGPLSRLTPFETTSKMVFNYRVLVALKSKAAHIYNYQLLKQCKINQT